jgi:hypothetical protein
MSIVADWVIDDDASWSSPEGFAALRGRCCLDSSIKRSDR